jgi:hypothetical protein
MSTFFISYTQSDSAWAEWIAWALEEEGHSVTIQKWDFRPGSNFVAEMQKAASTAEYTVAVLSSAYLDSSFAESEWIAAFAQDPSGANRKLIPVRIDQCNPKGLWKAVTHIDLVGLDAATARRQLIDGVRKGRTKPTIAPDFPGSFSNADHARVPFPGTEHQNPSASTSTSYMPKLKRSITDFEKGKFAKHAFQIVQSQFEEALVRLKQVHPDVDVDFTQVSSTRFRAEIFLRGKRRCRCDIWLGAMLNETNIGYAEGESIRGDAVNEILAVAVVQNELRIKALMGTFGRLPSGIDLNELTEDQAADYLWRRFVAALEG